MDASVAAGVLEPSANEEPAASEPENQPVPEPQPEPQPDKNPKPQPAVPTKVSASVDAPAAKIPLSGQSGNADLSATIEQAARENGIPSGILHAQANKESHTKTGQTSSKGAEGVMQIMPRTAASLGVDPNDPHANIHGGAKYLKQLHDRFGSWDKALAAYNWGPTNLHAAISKHGESWLAATPKETQNYVHEILTHPVIGPVQTEKPAAPVIPDMRAAPHTLSERVGDFFNMPSNQYDKKYAADDDETSKKIDGVLNHLIPFHKEMEGLQKSIEGTKAGKQVSELVHDQLAHPEGLAMGGVEGPEGEIKGAIEGLAAKESPLSGILSKVPGAIQVRPPAAETPQSMLHTVPGAILVKPAPIAAKTEITPVQQAVEAAGGVFKGQNKDGLVEITLPRHMTDKLALDDRMKPFVSVTMPEAEVTPESVKSAMEAKFKEFGGKSDMYAANPPAIHQTQEQQPEWQNENVAHHMASAWKEAGAGKTGDESSFLITKDHPNVPIPLPMTHNYHKETFSLVPDTTAIYHTHPDNSDPEPSAADRKIADDHHIKMYVMSSKGLSLYDPATKKVTWVAEGLNYLPENVESPQAAQAQKQVAAATDALDPNSTKKKDAEQAMKTAWAATKVPE